MNIIVTTLKTKLGAFGWAETLRRDRPREFTLPVGEVRGLQTTALRFTHLPPGSVHEVLISCPPVPRIAHAIDPGPLLLPA